VLDYLLKPITFDRFFQSAHKARDYHQLITRTTTADTSKAEAEPDYFFIKCGSKYEKMVYQGSDINTDFQGGGGKLPMGGFDDKGAEQQRANDYSTHCVHNNIIVGEQ
jgi:hypothetical protein